MERNKATDESLMRRTAALALEYLNSLENRQVAARAGRERLLHDLGGTLPQDGVEALQVIEDLPDAAEPELVASCRSPLLRLLRIGTDWQITDYMFNRPGSS